MGCRLMVLLFSLVPSFGGRQENGFGCESDCVNESLIDLGIGAVMRCSLGGLCFMRLDT